MPAPIQSSPMTVRLSRGNHTSPEFGACVVELASMLAGEPFSDRPRSVCPVLGGFLRRYNDGVRASERRRLYPCAAAIVGTGGDLDASIERARRLSAWPASGV